jgi:hypothetical protein
MDAPEISARRGHREIEGARMFVTAIRNDVADRRIEAQRSSWSSYCNPPEDHEAQVIGNRINSRHSPPLKDSRANRTQRPAIRRRQGFTSLGESRDAFRERAATSGHEIGSHERTRSADDSVVRAIRSYRHRFADVP